MLTVCVAIKLVDFPMHIRLLSHLLIGAAACGPFSAAHAETPVVSWELLSPEVAGQRCIERFTVNHVDSVEKLCFMQLPRPMRAVSEGDSLVEINAGYYYITSPRFGSGTENIIVDVECDWPLRAVAEGPESFHAVAADGKVIPVALHKKQSMTDAAMADPQWRGWMVPADSLYRLNSSLAEGEMPGPFDIVPSFKSVVPTGEGTFTEGMPIETATVAHSNPEFYRITLTPGKVLVEGASEQAIKTGVRTLRRRLLEPNGGVLPCAVIEDWPDFPYRALMIDVARNFQTPETMARLVELMADYRFNRLHFHVTDDEAWRLEIPGLPELTEVGARRGYTLDSHDFLPDIFAGTGRADNNLPTANGFYSRSEFIDFLRHCDTLGVAVIPEIESPGHARAAIKAMEARHRNSGDETYRLIEEGDTSVYTSAQLYHDNLMNPALPGTYRFIAKVVDEIAYMYREAGVELPGIHLGGDEVPEGAWDGSPSATALARRLGVSGRHGLQGEYVKRIAALMSERGIPLYGWQDICTGYDEDFHSKVAPAVGGMNCWVSPSDMANNVAVNGVKAGYPVIISNVDYFYMDMLYAPHPDERGLYWGGTVDELKALSGYPDTICPPQEGSKGKVIGVSGQLFAETVRSREDMERLLFPKCLGLAERGWNATPTYSAADFNALIGEKELPRLSRLGVATHLRQPGVLIKDGKIFMNSPYRNAEIHFTTDGTNPARIGSGVYRGPVPLSEISGPTSNGGQPAVRAILVTADETSVPTVAPLP